MNTGRVSRFSFRLISLIVLLSLMLSNLSFIGDVLVAHAQMENTATSTATAPVTSTSTLTSTQETYLASTATVTNTPTTTLTGTSSITPSPTSSLTNTPTGMVTNTPTPSPTESSTGTATPTSTSSLTSTSTQTPTTAATQTFTPSVTDTEMLALDFVDAQSVSVCHSDWDCEIVDSEDNKNLGERASLILDTQGLPHIAYLERNYVEGVWSYYQRYANWDGSQWNINVLEEVGNWHTSPSIKTDSNDIPHISYFEYSKLKYAKWNGTNFDINYVENESGKYSSLALDSDDNPHIGYCDGNDLKYTSWNGNSWDIEIIYTNCTGGGDFGPEITLALDNNDRPHILFVEPWDDGGSLIYGYWDGIEWQYLPIESSSNGRMALDKNGYPHVVYKQYTPEAPYGLLKYATWDGNVWSHTLLDSTENWIKYAGGITFDQDGIPHISYSITYVSSGIVKYATWDGNEWVIQEVDPVYAASLQYVPIAIDDGLPLGCC